MNLIVVRSLSKRRAPAYLNDGRPSTISTRANQPSIDLRLSNRVALIRHFYDKGDENHEGNHEINRVLDDDGDGRVGDVQRRHCRASTPTGDDRRDEAAGVPRVFCDDPRLLEAARLGGAR